VRDPSGGDAPRGAHRRDQRRVARAPRLRSVIVHSRMISDPAGGTTM
jgi:hypothetical protein